MIKEILGDFLPNLGEAEPVEPGCGCACESGPTARKYVYVDANVSFE
jgi:hypothetical protein